MYNLEFLEEILDSGVITAFAVFGSVSSVVSLALFVLMGIGLYSMAKKMELNSPWISFIPVVNTFALGRIAQRYVKRDGTASAKFGVILLVLYIIEIILIAVFAVFTVIAVVAIIANASDAVLNDTTMTLSMFSSFVPVVISYFVLLAVAIVYEVLYFVALWRIYSIFNNRNSTLFTVLSVFFSFLAPIFLFAIRNKEPKLTYGERMGFEEINV